MIESLICTSEMKKPEDGFSVSASSSNGTLSQRRIEFHPARKAFTGFSNGDGDFHIETLNPSSDSQRSAAQKAVALVSTGKKSKAGDFFENGLDPELISGTTLRRIGAGLANLGNTCYLNSVVQCLTYTEPFVAYLQNEKHQSSCRTAGFCAMCAIEDHVSRALQSSGRILAPKHLVMNLRCISRNFRIARQEDAHEYMVNLLESMHKCCLPSGVPSESPSAYEKSLVHRIFGGHLRSQVKCMQCSYCSNTFDPFLDLSLEIVKAGSLLKALHHFTAMEQLDGGERQYQCQCCKQKVRAYKQLTVHKAPYVLTIHLKRFGSHIPGSHISGHKIDKKVEFESTLDLKPFVSGAYEGELKYTLYGVLVHDGRTTHSGHYYCFVRTSSGMWYSLDDNEVFQVSEKTVLGQKAYMLFYVRDRRSLVPKKLVDGFHRENLVSNIIENKEWSNRMKDTFQNVLVEKRSCGMDYSGTAAQRDASGGSAANGPPVKESSVKPNGQIVPRLVVSKEHEMLLQKQNLSKNPVKGLPVSHPTNGHLEPKIMLQSVQSSVKGNSDIAAHSNDATVTPADEKVNGTESEDPRKEFSVSVATLSDHNFAETCTKKPITETFADKIDVMNDKEVNKAPVAVGHEKKFGKVNAIGVISPVVEPSDAHCLKTGKSGPNSTELGSMEKSGQSNKMIGHVQKEDLDHHHRWKVIKKKKKLQKSRVARMFLGSNLLFRTSMTHWKKKKHKRSKHLNVVLRGITQEDLLDGNCTSGHPEPSTSEKTVMLSLDSACERKKKSRSGKNKSNSTATEKNFGVTIGNFCTSNIDGNHRERIDQNSAELATNESPRKSVSLISSASSVGTREPNDSEDKKKALVRSELRSMLMRSVEETIAHWDGIELPTSQVLGSSSRPSTNIGYVADDWDEEYDRGKRKKVKSEKRSFTGPNPFQEVARMKTQLKKVKMDHTSSGNQPIRI